MAETDRRDGEALCGRGQTESVSRSKVVAKQPCDVLGRWDPKTNRIVVIDDSGNTGRTKKSPRYLIVAATVTDAAEEFVSIGRGYPTNTKHMDHPGILKFSTSEDDIRLDVLEGVNRIDAHIYAVVLDKTGVSSSISAQDMYKSSVQEVLSDAVAEENHAYCVIMDRHPGLSDDSGLDVRKEVAREKKRGIIDCKVEPIEDSEELRIQDFIASAIGHAYNSKPPMGGAPYEPRKFIDRISEKIVSLREK